MRTADRVGGPLIGSSPRTIARIAGGLWCAAIAAVRFGPWPMTMIHVAGVEFSPTHPPSTALVLYGLASSATAIAAAPHISRWLTHRPRAWKAVVAGNSVAMSVYLWHFTAAIVAGLLLWPAGLLPAAAEGTTTWWFEKLPLIGVAAIVTAVIVAAVAKVERRALLAPRRPWRGGTASMVNLGIATSAALKLWSFGQPVAAVIGLVSLCSLWFTVLGDRRGDESPDV